jgi:predicted SAM-dependent methyltransferase
VRLELGAGERPDPDYDVHADVLPLPGIQVRCRLDRLPFADASITALRANHVLEHQSWQLVEPTLREWARVLRPGARVDIGVPDARYIAQQWVEGGYDTREANHWLLGGHMEREAHKGVDERGVPRWIWNAHYTLFDADWLAELLEAAGFTEIDVSCYEVRNLRCYCRRGSPPDLRS